MSPHSGTRSMAAGDLSAQSFNRTQNLYRPYRHVPSLEMTHGPEAYCHRKVIENGAVKKSFRFFRSPRRDF